MKFSLSSLFLTAAIVIVSTLRADETPAPNNPTVAGSDPISHPASGESASSAPALQATSPAPSFTGDGWGVRKKLMDEGFTFNFDLQVDGRKSLSGGLNTRASAWRNLFEATLDIDTKRLLSLDGGRVYIDFQNADGPNASDKLIGDIQGIDSLDGVPRMRRQNRTQLAQLWYEQKAFNGLLRVKAGKVDANSEFDRSTTALEFLNQSTGASATLFTLPTYPDAATGINLFLNPSQDLQLGLGLYDGSLASGVSTGAMGPRTFFRNPQRLFLIAEVDKSWALGLDKLAGRLGVGGWYSTNTFAKFGGGETSGTGGPYVLLDQTLWRANPKDDTDSRGASLFLMGGHADGDVINTDYHVGGGFTWKGSLAARPADIWGMGANSVHLSEAAHPAHSFETSYEAFYRVQMTPWLSLKPDVQYITHPGGNKIRDALAATIRLEVVF